MFGTFLGSLLGASKQSPEGSCHYRVSGFAGHFRYPTLRTSTVYSVRLRALRSCVMPNPIAAYWYGNVDPFAIAYAFRPRLRTRLTLLRLTLSRNPWAYGGGVSHPSYRYSSLHFLFQKLHGSSRNRFCAAGMLPYHSSYDESEASVLHLMPENFRCRAARPVSYYALFK